MRITERHDAQQMGQMKRHHLPILIDIFPYPKGGSEEGVADPVALGLFLEADGIGFDLLEQACIAADKEVPVSIEDLFEGFEPGIREEGDIAPMGENLTKETHLVGEEPDKLSFFFQQDIAQETEGGLFDALHLYPCHFFIGDRRFPFVDDDVGPVAQRGRDILGIGGEEEVAVIDFGGERRRTLDGLDGRLVAEGAFGEVEDVFDGHLADLGARSFRGFRTQEAQAVLIFGRQQHPLGAQAHELGGFEVGDDAGLGADKIVGAVPLFDPGDDLAGRCFAKIDLEEEKFFAFWNFFG